LLNHFASDLSAADKIEEAIRDDYYDNYFGATARNKFDIKYRRAANDIAKYRDEAHTPKEKLTPRSRYLRRSE
jgi:hypothetical protein